jgi:hypothetical protein
VGISGEKDTSTSFPWRAIFSKWQHGGNQDEESTQGECLWLFSILLLARAFEMKKLAVWSFSPGIAALVAML